MTKPPLPQRSEEDGAEQPQRLTAEQEDGLDRIGDCRKEEDDHDGLGEPTLLVQAMLCLIAFVEGGDTQLLGSARKALQEDLTLTLTELNYMEIAQMVSLSLGGPLWGILADRGVLRRKTILVVGAVGQGLVTISLGCVSSLLPMILLRTLNGIFLAALRPICNGIIADVTAEQHRGKIFGRWQGAFIVGIAIVQIVVVPISRKTILGFEGWRVAFTFVGTLSVILSSLVLCLFREPPHFHAPNEHRGLRAVWDEVMHLFQFLRLPTFCMMILQGIFGTIPWTVMGNMVLYFQLSGIADGPAGVLGSAQAVAGIFGNVLGGMVSDVLTRRLGLHGRPLPAQISVVVGIPLNYLLFHGIPPCGTCFWGYLCLIIGFGLFGTWAQSGTNFPVLSHIVPASSRSRVLAWEMALENSIAYALGPFAVSHLAENTFGYTFGTQKFSGTDIHSARALGQAMVLVICVPWIVTFLVYTLMHWTYPRDVKKVLKLSGPEQGEGSTDDSPRADTAATPAVV
mmetsp:Transcript_81829/g.205909  ORF Transcript_81829/g.205909 Transcript_81829/m.205909 type:complete len:512 (-) Transcript_81829:688-2223(-)